MIIYLIDDHPLIIEAIKNTLLLQPEIKQVNTYTSAESFLADPNPILPDIIITDLQMPGISGADLVSSVRKAYGEKIKIIILSSTTDAQTVRRLMKAGVNGYLSKSSSLQEVIDAIYEVYNGKQYVSKDLVEHMLEMLFVSDKAEYHLTNRESEVLQKVCSGYTLKEIGQQLNLSINTVKYYHREILAKLNVKRTADLVVFAMQNGLYNPESKPKN